MTKKEKLDENPSTAQEREHTAEFHDHGHTHDGLAVHHTHEDAHHHDIHHAHPHEHGHSHEHDHDAGGDTVKKNNEAVITVRAHSGLSGDMMVSGLAGLAGLTRKELDALVSELNMPALDGCLMLEERSVNHIAGLGCNISLPREHVHRTLPEISAIIAGSAMPEDAKQLSVKAFTILAEAEAAVHGIPVTEVAFHEVGALDSILDTCMVCRIFSLLGPARFICSPLPLADGVIHCAHGRIASPAPAVLRMLNDVPVCGFSGQGETVTPTALSLLKALGTEFGAWPTMTIQKTVISYGSKIFSNAPNGAIWALGRP